MFWDEEHVNSLQKLLNSGKPVDLAEILKDPYCLQELRQGNKQLLTSHDNMLKLVKDALRPEIDVNQPVETHYSNANLCTEVLSVSSIDQMAEAFLENPACLKLLSETLDDPSNFNAVIGIFYSKIFSALMSKNFDATLSFMKETNFLEKSRRLVKYGAIADLIESLIRLNNDEQNIQQIKQFLLDEEFLPKLLALLDGSTEVSVHENIADIYIDILRNLREVLVVNDDKTDILHELFMSEKTVHEILDRMLKREQDGLPISYYKRASLLMNGMSMISALIEHNTIGTCPSILFENGEQELTNWNGGGPGETNSVFDRTKMWLPDKDKIAETFTAQRTADIVSVIIEDLDQEFPGDIWPWMLKLLNELADTNHLNTHQLLVAGFKKANFKRLFDLVRKHPLVHIFHHLLRNIVTFALYSDLGEAVSPLVDYFITDCEMFAMLKEGVYPLTDVPKMVMMSIRSFHVYLADSFTTAAKRAPKRDVIETYIKKSSDWSGDTERTIEKGLQIYWERNRPDECKVPSQQSSARNQYRRKILSHESFLAPDFNEDIETFSRFECTAEIPDLDPVTGPTSVLVNFSVRPPFEQDGLQINLHENDAREDAFENAGEFRPLTELFPNLSAHKPKVMKLNDDNAWPGETTSEPIDDIWGQGFPTRLSNGSHSSADEWPSFNSSASNNSSKDNSFGATDFANVKSSVDDLDDSVKSKEENPPDLWDSSVAEISGNWVADFGQSRSSTGADPFSANESNA